MYFRYGCHRKLIVFRNISEFVKNRKFFWGISRFWWKIEILVKNPDFPPIFNPRVIVIKFVRENFRSKIEFSFLSKIKISVENHDFGRKSRFWSKITILVENHDFGRKMQILVKIGKNQQFQMRHLGQDLIFWNFL